MGDPRRFNLFADLIAARFAPDLPVVDVAGGRGGLQAALRVRGFGAVTSWDKRRSYAKHRARASYRFGYFDSRTAPTGYGLAVGMHPDGGTDHIIGYAIRHRVPFVVCPCCTIPSLWSYRGPDDQRRWFRHLLGMAEVAEFRCETVTLPMRGCADVIVGLPPLPPRERAALRHDPRGRR